MEQGYDDMNKWDTQLIVMKICVPATMRDISSLSFSHL